MTTHLIFIQSTITQIALYLKMTFFPRIPLFYFSIAFCILILNYLWMILKSKLVINTIKKKNLLYFWLRFLTHFLYYLFVFLNI